VASQNRITHAWWLEGWDHDNGDRKKLEAEAEPIAPADYTQEMKDNIFCPACCKPLFRSPSGKAKFSNKRVARYNHFNVLTHGPCRLRAPKAELMRFASEELARQAIDNGELTVVYSFQSARPEIAAEQVEQGSTVFHEDVDGPLAAYPISRYKGESFQLPTTISTVASICRRFDINLNKYYLLPGRNSALPLTSELIDIRTVTEENLTPKLYFAKIIQSSRMGQVDTVHLRMTYFECNPRVKDFCLKATIAEQREKGIDNDLKNRFILIWGKITESGIGLCINRPKWGEYALLPEKYEKLLSVLMKDD